MRYLTHFIFGLLVVVGLQSEVFAQFEEPEIEKVSTSELEEFDQQFSSVKWTGQGLNSRMDIDGLKTPEVRARLQAVFGEPTLKIEDMVDRDDFRLAYAIQFEYRFVVNDEIPFIVLDVFGPFGRGLSYSGPSEHIDMMRGIKRTFNKMLMDVEEGELGDYTDYYYSADKEQWYRIQYSEGKFQQDEIDAPEGMSIE